MAELKDIHRTSPTNEISINRVGISGLDFPLMLKRKDKGVERVSAVFDMYGSLLKERKGIDMSRFPETLMEWVNKPLSGDNFEELLRHLQVSVKADDVFITARFKYFLKKVSPVSKKEMLSSYNCRFSGLVVGSRYSFYQEVVVPATSLCPCSKELCLIDREKDIGKGAHNQRSLITIQVKNTSDDVWLEDLIELAESSGSCRIYPLLKRPDEQFVTKQAYETPKFVEDIVRDAAYKTMQLNNCNWFRVKVENFESIHNHSAVAYIERSKKGGYWYRTGRGFI